MQPHPSAVLFDLDGTLVNTEPLWEKAFAALARRYGWQLDVPTRHRMLGAPNRECVRLLRSVNGATTSDIDVDVAWLENQVIDKLEGPGQWHAGAQRLLAQVRDAGLRTALVTASPRNVACSALGDELHRFDVVITNEDVAQAKPHPEPYLSATQLLDVAVSECVVIEDSPTGVRSARAAGCRVVAVGESRELYTLSGVATVPKLADITVPWLEDLIRQEPGFHPTSPVSLTAIPATTHHRKVTQP